ncbi:Heavy metal tolerance protein [Cytospora mali]|uniref:Heavy metal tolerance protein n=1 Tax=Cytospora mali TaxID=578113 RepID=A0A194VRM5_CYTMA|nr:Heavy metal tolerance protein [Valsa mali]
MAPSFELLSKSLYYAYPTLVSIYYFICYAIATCTLRTTASKDQHPRRSLITFLMVIAVLTYFSQVLLILISQNPAREDAIVSLLSCVLVFGLELAVLHETKTPIWHPYIGSFAIGIIFDPLLEALSLHPRGHESARSFRFMEASLVATRLTCIMLILTVYFACYKRRTQEIGSDSERQSLLRKKGDSEETLVSDYGATDAAEDDSTKASNKGPECEWERRQRIAKEQRDKRLKETGSWWTYAMGFKLFLPYVWPVNNRGLQVRAVLVGLCLLINNGLNVLIPTQIGIVTNTLTNSFNTSRASSLNSPPISLYNTQDSPKSPSAWDSPWIQVLIFAGLKLSASEAGVSLLRKRLWLPVEFYSERAIVEAAHSHVMNLDANFHDTQSLSDVLVAIQNGQSISEMLETICFQALPNLIDLVVAFIYLSVMFGPYEGFITISTSVLFLYISTTVIARLRSARETEISAYFEEHYVLQSGISGWSTVSSFNQVQYEQDRYSSAIQDRIAKQKVVWIGYMLAHAFQYLVLLAGLLAGLFLAVYQVTHGIIRPGAFLTLLTYWSQLMSPLSFFAGLGRSISRNLLQAERLLDIMQTKPSVVNKPNAPPFQFKAGSVQFKDVKFSYDNKKQVLKHIDFSVQPGTTIAFVGQTGAGKSTILKLLDRFYDVTEGCIKIDGQDIREVDLHSLRAHIGVVPQNPSLFNDTIMSNIRYAKLEATDEEVFEACRAAAIHDQILGFSDGYETRVGERGIKLSGGELQRVAIARAILRQPKIVLLDEATSAIDTETEFLIQQALRRLCKNRTTFIVAHRLSTIVNADRIVVVANGEILEQGNHETLIAAGGKYADLWSKQIFVKPKGQDADDEGHKNVAKDLNTPKRSTTTDTKEDGAQSKTLIKDGAKQSAEMKTPSGHKKEV